MIARWRQVLADAARLGLASARLVAGRRYWIVTLLPLIWFVNNYELRPAYLSAFLKVI